MCTPLDLGSESGSTRNSLTLLKGLHPPKIHLFTMLERQARYTSMSAGGFDIPLPVTHSLVVGPSMSDLGLA